MRQLRESSLTDVRSAVEEEDCPSLEVGFNGLTVYRPAAKASAHSRCLVQTEPPQWFLAFDSAGGCSSCGTFLV